MAGGNHDQSMMDHERQNAVTTMPRPLDRKAKTARFLHSDKIVGRLGDFPELTKAVRAGDVAMVNTLCAQLFHSNYATRRCQSPATNAA